MLKSDNMELKREKPDHRKIGVKLDLFSFHDVSPGAPFWHPKGMIVVKELEKYIRELQDQHGYVEISTPIMVKKKLFKQSGHWEFFKEDMFRFKVGNEDYALKPMNCPESTLVYSHTKRSYRDLPLRLAELGRLHRNELSGVLGGLLRVRQITMDDAHIYCRPDQIKSELVLVLKNIQQFYQKLGLPVAYGLATRPKKAMGDIKKWKVAEQTLAAALRAVKLPYRVLKGEGAFYGPKIHFDIKDSLGRGWTIATAQLDFQMPERFELEYVNEKGKTERPAMIHRAIFGSFERFIGILLEHYSGALPLWLSPEQIWIVPVASRHKKYAKGIIRELTNNELRIKLKDENETVSKKIRDGETQKIPYLLVVGDKEEKSKQVRVRKRGRGDVGSMKLDKFLEKAKKEMAEHA